MMKISGIYKITNTVNGNYYIGSSVNLRKRLNGHRSDLVCNRHNNAHLQRAWIKYGENCFTFEIIELCEKERLIEREQYYIDELQPTYNICQAAGSCLGNVPSDATKQKLSEAMMGERNTNFGREKSEETKKKLSLALSGERNPNYGKPGTMLGRKFTEETLLRLSESHKGKHPTEESRKRMSESHMGHPVSEELRTKFGERTKGNQYGRKNLGKRRTEESKRKMSEKAIAAWQRRKEVAV